MSVQHKVKPRPQLGLCARVKIVVSGSSAVGKTYLINGYQLYAQQQWLKQRMFADQSIHHSTLLEDVPALQSAQSSADDSMAAIAEQHTGMATDAAGNSAYTHTVAIDIRNCAPTNYTMLMQLRNTVDHTTSLPLPPGAVAVRIQPCFYDCSGALLQQYKQIQLDFYIDFSALILVFDVMNRQSIDNLQLHIDAVNQRNSTVATAAVAAMATAADSSPTLASTPSGFTYRLLIVGIVNTRKYTATELSEAREVSTAEAELFAARVNGKYIEHNELNTTALHLAINELIIDSADAIHQQRYTLPYKPTHRTRASQDFTNYSGESNDFSPVASSLSTAARADAMSVDEIKLELMSLQVRYDDCHSKHDFVQRLKGSVVIQSIKDKQKEAQINSNNSSSGKSESSKDSTITVVAAMDVWARGKDVKMMLNDIHDSSSLQHYSDEASVEHSYRKALLKIHPSGGSSSNSNGSGNRDGGGSIADDVAMSFVHVQATEMLKRLNGAYDAYKKENNRAAQQQQQQQTRKQL